MEGVSGRIDDNAASARKSGVRVWVAGLIEMVAGAGRWAACCSLSWFRIFAWTSSIVASLISGLGFGSVSGICCSALEMYPILAKYCCAMHRSMVKSRGFCIAVALDVCR